MYAAATLFATLMASAYAAAIPTPQGGIIQLLTNITYYQGGTSANICNLAVSSGTIAERDCHQLYTSGISVSALEDQACTYTLYSGSTTCGSDASEVVATQIAADEDAAATCIETGVLDGGAHTFASGMWNCS